MFKVSYPLYDHAQIYALTASCLTYLFLDLNFRSICSVLLQVSSHDIVHYNILIFQEWLTDCLPTWLTCWLAVSWLTWLSNGQAFCLNNWLFDLLSDGRACLLYDKDVGSSKAVTLYRNMRFPSLHLVQKLRFHSPSPSVTRHICSCNL